MYSLIYDYAAALYPLADTLDCPLVNVYQRSGGYTTANTNGLMTSAYYPSTAGHTDWALLAASRIAIEKFLPFSFLAVNKMTVEFKRVERRHVYTTPKSYLELLKLYGVLLDKKRFEAKKNIERLDNGLLKLKETSESVASACLQVWKILSRRVQTAR